MRSPFILLFLRKDPYDLGRYAVAEAEITRFELADTTFGFDEFYAFQFQLACPDSYRSRCHFRQ